MEHIFSKPNQITLIRIILIPLFVASFLIEIPHKEYISGFIFVVLSISDMFDGYIARKKNQVSSLGKIMDPIADKLLITAALVLLAGRGVEAWMAAVIIAREWIITFLRILILNKRVIPADKLGKAKTAMQTIAILAAILNLQFTWHLMLIAVILTVVSGISYLIKMAMLLDENVMNIPNIITLMRFFLLPLFAVNVIKSQLNYALIIFAVIALSDKIDGISARMMKQVTEFGKAFDSFTDWSSFLISFVLFSILGYISFIWVALLLVPAIVISALKLVYIKKSREIPVTPIARISVVMAYASIVAILIDFAYSKQVLGITVAIIYLSMFRYIFISKPIIKRKGF